MGERKWGNRWQKVKHTTAFMEGYSILTSEQHLRDIVGGQSNNNDNVRHDDRFFFLFLSFCVLVVCACFFFLLFGLTGRRNFHRDAASDRKRGSARLNPRHRDGAAPRPSALPASDGAAQVSA